MKATRASFALVTNHSTATSFTSNAYSVLDIDVEAVQINYAGSPSGTFAIQGSVDHAEDSFGNVTVAGQWANLYFSINGAAPTASAAVPSNPTPIIFDTYGTGVSWLRVVYTGSGTGTFSAFVSGKRLGA